MAARYFRHLDFFCQLLITSLPEAHEVGAPNAEKPHVA